VKCLTVRQPWATLLCDPWLPKWIETRSRRTHIRGTIGIIAGLWTPPTGVFEVGDYEMVRWFDLLGYGDGWKLQNPNGGDPGFPADGIHPDLPFGALIGTVDLYDCTPIVERESDHDSLVSHVCIDSPAALYPGAVEGGMAADITDELPYGVFSMAILYSGSTGGYAGDDLTDQLPYGDFTPGRWAWLTRNPVLFDEPVPMRGAQHWQEDDDV
jgi:hypothetical protein